MSDIKIFNEKPFYIILIEPSQISHLDWNNPNYVQSLVSLPSVKTFLVEPNNLFENIQKLLNITEESKLKHVMNFPIAEEPNYVYEMLYIDTLNKSHNLIKNDFGSLLHTENEEINGNVIIIKSHVPTLSSDMFMEDMTSDELFKIVKNRGFSKIVVYEEDTFRQEEIYGDIDIYAKKFFDEEYYTKMEIAFLKHNINIWYIKSEYGNQVCGSLINVPIEKCIIFTMLTDSIRGSITVDEITKIFKLSTVLEPPFRPDVKWFDEEKDEHGRTIINNKYRILDNVYQEKIIQNNI
jgi:hypothetical protein